MFGGDGADSFHFGTVAEIDKDQIRDFSHADTDLINLRHLDARDGKPGNQKFTYVGGKDFSGAKRDLRFRDGKLKGDTNGDHHAGFTVRIDIDKLAERDFLFWSVFRTGETASTVRTPSCPPSF
jgi:serralysin